MKIFKARTLTAVILCMSLLMGTGTYANAQATSSEIRVALRGAELAFDVDPYVNESDRTMVEVRGISEALGADITWDEASQTVTIVMDDTALKLVIGQATYNINGESNAMDTEAVIIDGRTMVPVRFVSEALGMNVEWDDSEKMVTITDVDTEMADRPEGGPMDDTRIEGDNGPGAAGQPMIDIADAAEELGVTEEALIDAIGEPGQGQPDFAEAAETLGVTEAELIDALGMPEAE